MCPSCDNYLSFLCMLNIYSFRLPATYITCCILACLPPYLPAWLNCLSLHLHVGDTDHMLTPACTSRFLSDARYRVSGSTEKNKKKGEKQPSWSGEDCAWSEGNHMRLNSGHRGDPMESCSRGKAARFLWLREEKGFHCCATPHSSMQQVKGKGSGWVILIISLFVIFVEFSIKSAISSTFTRVRIRFKLGVKM